MCTKHSKEIWIWELYWYCMQGLGLIEHSRQPICIMHADLANDQSSAKLTLTSPYIVCQCYNLSTSPYIVCQCYNLSTSPYIVCQCYNLSTSRYIVCQCYNISTSRYIVCQCNNLSEHRSAMRFLNFLCVFSLIIQLLGCLILNYTETYKKKVTLARPRCNHPCIKKTFPSTLEVIFCIDYLCF